MKDEKHMIDDLFKNRLYDIESDVELASWDAISKNIQSTRTYAPKKWLYGLGLAASVVVVFVYFTDTNERSAATVTEELHRATVPVETNTAVVDNPADNLQVKESTGEAATVKISHVQQIRAGEERKTLRLPDGNEVLLNRNSSISYSTEFLTDRTVYVSGEVYFNIQASDTKKLIIKSPLAQIEAGASSFIIKSDKKAGKDEIAVSTGKASVKSLLANEDRITIFAGNNAVINGKGTITQHTLNDLNYNDWVTQKIIFNNTSLHTVFETLEAYYNVSLKADNSEIMNCHFTGTFERNNIDEILQVLSVSFNLSFNQTSKEYILSGNGCK